MMKITGLSHLFKWENLHNWWLTKYVCVCVCVCVCERERERASLNNFLTFWHPIKVCNAVIHIIAYWFVSWLITLSKIFFIPM